VVDAWAGRSILNTPVRVMRSVSLAVYSHEACHAGDYGVGVYRLGETPVQLVAVLAVPKERRLGHCFCRVRIACIPCTTRHASHYVVRWGIESQIGTESDRQIVPISIDPKRVCIEYPWRSSFRARRAEEEGGAPHPRFRIGSAVDHTTEEAKGPM